MDNVLCATAIVAVFVACVYSDTPRLFAKSRIANPQRLAWGQISDSTPVAKVPMLFPPYVPGIVPRETPADGVFAKYPKTGPVSAMPIGIAKNSGMPMQSRFSGMRSWSSPSKWYPIPREVASRLQ